MSHFPSPLFPPDSIFQVRHARNRQIIRSIMWGIALRTLLIAFELAGAIFFHSSSLLLDSFSTFVDVVCSFLLIFFIRLAGKSPDKNHPFGYGRYEPLAGLQLGLMLVLIGAGMVVQQSLQLKGPSLGGIAINSYAWVLPLCALFLLEIAYFIVNRTAKKQNSPALAADALHYRIDGITSLFATIALFFGAYFPSWSFLFDHMGAIVIALVMIALGAYSVRDNLYQLLDRVPSPYYFEKVRRAAKRTPGVLEIEKTRIQLYGPDAHVDIDVEVDPHLSVEDAHHISQKVRVEIQIEWPAVRDVTVHIEPYYPNDH